MYYKYSSDEVELLMDTAIDLAARRGRDSCIGEPSDNPHGRAEFKRWCRIIGELSRPTPLAISDLPLTLVSEVADVIERETRFRRAPVDSEREQQREFARREGLDFEKEFGPIDPRARAPRCVHGKLFSEACPTCEGRCAHGLTLVEPCAACNRGVQPLVQSP